jgi:hypothetical protein
VKGWFPVPPKKLVTTDGEPKPLLSYDQVRAALGTGAAHLLIGNGFSISCDPVFGYENLFAFARENGLPDRVTRVFEHVGTNNFEAVLRLLHETDWAARHYGLLRGDGQSELQADATIVQRALVEAVARTHLEHPGMIDDARKTRCVSFLEPYHNVFCTNYDLLLYWVEMSALERLKGRDGFLADPDEPDAEYVVFREHVGGRKGLFYIHGALHLYMVDGQLRKHTWSRTGTKLTDLIRAGIERSEYPLFVAEGDAAKKYAQIEANGYLSYCLGKLSRIEKSLVVYGFSFGDSDHHIMRAIADARKLETLYVGLYYPLDHPDSQRIVAAIARLQARRDKTKYAPLKVHFFDSKTAALWDEPRTT